jgi:hypothetical protein
MEQTGIRGAESWQFFAFVFTAVIALPSPCSMSCTASMAGESSSSSLLSL